MTDERLAEIKKLVDAARAVLPELMAWVAEFQKDFGSPPPTGESTPIGHKDFSARVQKSLTRSRFYEPIATYEELAAMSSRDLLERRNFGDFSLNEVRVKLKSLGLKLKDDHTLAPLQ